MRALAAWILTCLVVVLGGCASLPPTPPRPASTALPLNPGTPLGRAAIAQQPAPQDSGFRLLFNGGHSMHARLELARRAQVSLDLQYYQLKSDATGRLLLRSLRNAAARGVRVRLLIDDLYTAGDDDLLLGLAAHPNVELRLFNPFPAGRSSLLNRFAASLADFGRVHRRMHNKMFIADGALAVVGGRNVADEYNERNDAHNFFDFDVLALGPVLPQLQTLFDAYWNSRHAYPVEFVIHSERDTDQRRKRFEALTGGADTPEQPPQPPRDRLGQRLLGDELDDPAGAIALHRGRAEAFADAPDKIVGAPALLGPARAPGPFGAIESIQHLVVSEFASAQRELVITTPYLIPGELGLQRLRAALARGVQMSMLTNSLASTDEPLVHNSYRRYRVQMLQAGLELYEVSPVRGRGLLRGLLKGQPAFRLHNKSGVIDGQRVYIGSLNLDPRSREHNTEIGLIIHSPALARDVIEIVGRIKSEAAYRLRLTDDGQIEWIATGANGTERLRDEPESSFFSRWLLPLLAPLVPEGLL